MNKRLSCGINVSVTETGSEHKTQPNRYFWQVEVDCVAQGQGYADSEEMGLEKARATVASILRRSACDLGIQL